MSKFDMIFDVIKMWLVIVGYTVIGFKMEKDFLKDRFLVFSIVSLEFEYISKFMEYFDLKDVKLVFIYLKNILK